MLGHIIRPVLGLLPQIGFCSHCDPMSETLSNLFMITLHMCGVVWPQCGQMTGDIVRTVPSTSIVIMSPTLSQGPLIWYAGATMMKIDGHKLGGGEGRGEKPSHSKMALMHIMREWSPRPFRALSLSHSAAVITVA